MDTASIFYEATGTTGEALRVPQVQILLLHDLRQPQEAPFRRLLGSLARTHALISYSDAVERIGAGQIDEPCVTFSFDDGLRGSLRAAAILDEFGAPGCFFVCPSVLDAPTAPQAARFCRERLRIEATDLLAWPDLERLVARGHEVGSHSMTHPDLTQVDEPSLDEELSRSRDLLLQRLGSARHFALPYGTRRHFNARIVETVRKGGYESCASAVRGSYSGTVPTPLGSEALRRDGIRADWPGRHVLFFMSRNARRSS